METKPAIKSKLVWTNFLGFIAVALTALLAEPSFNEMVGATGVMILTALNMFFRIFKTDTVIEGTIKPKDNLKILEEQSNQDIIDEYGV